MLRDADIAAEKTCQLNKKRVLKSLYLDILENTNFIVIFFFLTGESPMLFAGKPLK